MLKRRIFGVLVICLLTGAYCIAQNTYGKDSSGVEKARKVDKLRLLPYVRVICDAKGSVRADENLVLNYRLLNWLKVEAAFRWGERPTNFNSYCHYKLEFQTKSFWKTVRVVARISDNIINFPAPAYRKTNELFAIETKFPFGSRFQGLASGGYVFSTQQNNVPDALPTGTGQQANYPIFKLSVRYLLQEKGFVEVVFGSYDVFNPYEINRPFFQLATEYELSHVCTLYSYLRYQYDYNVVKPYNYFLGLGLMFHLMKK
jgi:hypothetical protein